MSPEPPAPDSVQRQGDRPPAASPDPPDLARSSRPTSRRRWLRGLLAASLIPYLAWWGALAAWRRDQRGRARLALPRPSADGVTFHDAVILVREGPTVRALSSRCPHLGCRIQRAVTTPDGPVLVCPCHGSRFDRAGRRLDGPATRDLAALPVEPDPSAGPEALHVVVLG